MHWFLSEAEIDHLIREDAPAGDLTTACLGIGTAAGRMALSARDPMCLAGVEVAASILRRVGLTVRQSAASGDRLGPGAPVIEAEGRADALHLVWRTAKNLMESLSGIATATRDMVDAAAAVDPAVAVALTRKTFPGSRRLSQAAGLAGGGVIHRAGISETVLVFAEHRSFAPSLTLADMAVRLRRAAPEKKLAIEVGDLAEARDAIAAGFDVIQLERFEPAAIRAVADAAREADHRVLVAAAGGVTPSNVAQVVAAGAGLIVTSWPYAARPRDLATHLGPVSDGAAPAGG